jgi:hypothetical protein
MPDTATKTRVFVLFDAEDSYAGTFLGVFSTREAAEQGLEEAFQDRSQRGLGTNRDRYVIAPEYVR